MAKFRGKPSSWLLKNSMGFPDFLFTILTYSILLLIFVTIVWVSFGIITIIYSGTPRAEWTLKAMESMKTGLVSLAGIIFGLAGSYTVRRFKKDEHYLQKKRLDFELGELESSAGQVLPSTGQAGLRIVTSEEDI
ncbi:MAG: hypothetical protein D6715_05185 [Calditrichaeota bacterium]|nr:MAG: hypothetical protein D6715_05185 [Calditrichota bacterium]